MSTLPHCRYDQFKDLIEDYKEMIDHVDISLCPCSTFRDIQAGDYSIPAKSKEEAALVCSWPFFHNDIATLKETGKIVHVIQGKLVSDPLRDTRVGRRKRDAIKLLDEEKIIELVGKHATELVTHLSSRMEDKVYKEEDIKIIKNTRILLETRNLMQSVVSRGASAVANLTFDRFLASAEEVDSELLQRVDCHELRLEYREFLRRLESLSKVPANKELGDMELLGLFLNPDNQNLYENIEAVLSVMARASLLISVESVVESWISVMEHHASQRRTLGEMLLHEEMVIAINGPLLVHCDSIVKVIEIPLICITNIFFCFRKLSKTALLTERTPRKDLATLSVDQKTY